MKNLNLFLFLFIPLPAIISGLILIGISGREDLFLDWKKDLPRISIALIISLLILSSLILLNNKNRLEPNKISEVQTTSMAKIGEILFVEHMIPVVVIFIYFFSFFIGIYFVSKIRM
jgi:NADH:ubiquinone oxidoreductase subunit 6 (subunit J)